MTVRPSKTHANSTVQASGLNWGGGVVGWGGQMGRCLVQHINRQMDHLWVCNPSFIIICPYLDKLIGTAVKEPDCLSSPPTPPPVLQFNFVGKLLGPRGNSMKRLQEETGAKMSILGKGSMRDKDKV